MSKLKFTSGEFGLGNGGETVSGEFFFGENSPTIFTGEFHFPRRFRRGNSLSPVKLNSSKHIKYIVFNINLVIFDFTFVN